MASYPLKAVEHAGLLAPPASIRLGHDGKIGPGAIVAINQTLAAIVNHINKGLSIGTSQAGTQTGNFQNQWLVFTSPSGANTEFELPHGLGRVPIGFTVWFVNKGAVVYASNFGSWNKERILLKCNTATTEVVLELA
jgi:hypothetical protein